MTDKATHGCALRQRYWETERPRARERQGPTIRIQEGDPSLAPRPRLQNDQIPQERERLTQRRQADKNVKKGRQREGWRGGDQGECPPTP